MSTVDHTPATSLPWRNPLGGASHFAPILPLVIAMVVALAAALGPTADAKGGAKKPEDYDWTFEGVFGTYDRPSMQRGYQVYKELCAACHSMDLIAFRHLGEKGAPFYEDAYPDPIRNPYIALLAERFGEEVRGVKDLDEGGLEITRTPAPSDHFPAPYSNPLQAAAVNGGAVPPDFSTIVKARKGGADYIRSLLIGYTYPVPDELEVAPGAHYNPYYPGDVSGSWNGDPSQVPYGGFFAMAAPITEGTLFEYLDGTPFTVEQAATDVSHFLAWASHPHLEARKSLGRIVVVYLSLLAILLWFSYRQVWRNVKH